MSFFLGSPRKKNDRRSAMESKRECPYCGGEVRTRCHFGKKAQKWHVNVTCDAGHSVNLVIDKPANTPIPEVAEIAIHAFCHPAHICKGMVNIKRSTADTIDLFFIALDDEHDPRMTGCVLDAQQEIHSVVWDKVPTPTPPPVQTGMVMVSVETAETAKNAMGCLFMEGLDDPSGQPAFDELTAAIDAARKEG
jgi:hypothetical protein